MKRVSQFFVRLFNIYEFESYCRRSVEKAENDKRHIETMLLAVSDSNYSEVPQAEILLMIEYIRDKRAREKLFEYDLRNFIRTETN